MKLTKIHLLSGDVWTELSPDAVRTYLSSGSKTGSIPGFLEETKTTPIRIAVHAIEYIYG